MGWWVRHRSAEHRLKEALVKGSRMTGRDLQRARKSVARAREERHDRMVRRIADIEASLAWVGEVNPERMRYDCVRLEISRDQWNAMRLALGLPEMPRK